MNQLFMFNTYSIAAAHGLDTYIQQLTEYLSNTEIDITLVYLRADKPSVFVEKKNGIRYIYIPSPRFGDKNNPNRYNLCFSKSISILLRPYIESKQKSIFHLNFMNDSTLCDALKKTFSCKIILTVHYAEWAFPLFGNKKRFVEILSKPIEELASVHKKNIALGKTSAQNLFHACDHIITVAKHEAKTLQEIYRVDNSKITTINNGLKDTFIALPEKEKLQLRKDFFIENSEKVILFVGRLDKMKGFTILLKAFELSLQKDKNIRLLAVGGGDIEENLGKINKYWSKITFTGFLKKDLLYHLYTIADVGVVPFMYEEFDYVATKMMMHGLPIVANRTTGLAEIVEDEKTGSLVQLSDDDSLLEEQALLLSEKISHILANEETK